MFHVSKDSTDDLNALPILLFPDDRCLESLYILAKGKKFRGRNKIKNRWRNAIVREYRSRNAVIRQIHVRKFEYSKIWKFKYLE